MFKALSAVIYYLYSLLRSAVVYWYRDVVEASVLIGNSVASFTSKREVATDRVVEREELLTVSIGVYIHVHVYDSEYSDPRARGA